MATYDEDGNFLVSDSGGAPPASPLLEKPGIGLGTGSPEADRQAFLDSRSTMGKIALPFQEMRAARQGRPSEFQQMQIEKQAKRRRDLEEIKAFSDLTNKTFEEAEKLTGPARDSYIELQSKVLNSFSPGSGELLKTLADDPEYGKLVMKNAEKSPTLKTALDLGGLRKARELMKSPEGAKLIRGEIEGAELPAIRTKLQTLGLAAQELMSPARYKQMQADGFISPVEVAELNTAAAAHPKYKAAALSEEQLSLAARNEDATYGMAGFATSKTAQEVLKKRGESTVKGAKETKMNPATVSVNGKNVSALVDEQGNYFDANTRQRLTGVSPQITAADEQKNRELAGRGEGVVNLEKAVDTLEKIAKNNPRSAAGLFSGISRGVEYVSGSLNPEGKGTAPATQAVQLRDSIIAGMGTLGRLSNQDRQRIENALQVGSGGNPKNLPLAISILRDNIKKEKAEVGAGRARPKPGGGAKDYSGMSDDDLLKALSGG